MPHDELISMCRYGGGSLLLSQGAGGNASLKISSEGLMLIKASGFRLSQVREGHGYLSMKMPREEELLQTWEGASHQQANSPLDAVNALIQSCVVGGAHLRPSMETWLHLALGRAVLHTHAVYANAFLCMQGGTDILRELLSKPVVTIPYVTPGPLLGMEAGRSVKAFAAEWGVQPSHILLENHGLVTSAARAVEAIRLVEDVVEAGHRYFGMLSEPDLAKEATPHRLREPIRRVQQIFPRCLVRPAQFRALQEPAYEELPLPLVPDDVVCTPGGIVALGRGEEACLAVRNCFENEATAIHISGAGFIFLGSSHGMITAMEEQLMANVLVRRLVRRRGTCRVLPYSACKVLIDLETEKYRQKMLAADAAWARRSGMAMAEA